MVIRGRVLPCRRADRLSGQGPLGTPPSFADSSRIDGKYARGGGKTRKDWRKEKSDVERAHQRQRHIHRQTRHEHGQWRATQTSIDQTSTRTVARIADLRRGQWRADRRHRRPDIAADNARERSAGGPPCRRSSCHLLLEFGAEWPGDPSLEHLPALSSAAPPGRSEMHNLCHRPQRMQNHLLLHSWGAACVGPTGDSRPSQRTDPGPATRFKWPPVLSLSGPGMKNKTSVSSTLFAMGSQISSSDCNDTSLISEILPAACI